MVRNVILWLEMSSGGKGTGKWKSFFMFQQPTHKKQITTAYLFYSDLLPSLSYRKMVPLQPIETEKQDKDGSGPVVRGWDGQATSDLVVFSLECLVNKSCYQSLTINHCILLFHVVLPCSRYMLHYYHQI